MQWDLVNPWARLYQLNSTHPLTALRIQALNQAAEEFHQPITHPLPADRRIRWGAFPVQLLLWMAPGACAIATVYAALLAHRPMGSLHASPVLAPALLVLTGLAWMLRTSMRYAGAFRPATIASLIGDAEASEMQPRAVRLDGTIIGFGVPGAWFCSDLVIRDSTGILFVLYRPVLPLARALFALTKAAGYIGQKVTLDGWFRRGRRPYIEIARMAGEDGSWFSTFASGILHGAGAVVALAGLAWLAMLQ